LVVGLKESTTTSVPSSKDEKMLVVSLNAVKVESVPLKFNPFAPEPDIAPGKCLNRGSITDGH
jgi:hypothetical protein